MFDTPSDGLLLPTLGAVIALCVGCANPPAAPLRAARTPDASSQVAMDGGTGEDAAPVPALVAAPTLDASSIIGLTGEPEAELSVEGTSNVDVAVAVDGCVRVAFAAGAPVDVALGPRSIAARARGVVPENGTVCERAGHTLRLSFSGRANVRYQVFRTR